MSINVNPSIWALTAISGERQWGGNIGYEDDPERLYRYDSQVSNHLRLRDGDIVVIRDRNYVLGISTIESISAKDGQKRIRRCPVCGTAGIKRRHKMLPTWRCKEAHEFEEPNVNRHAKLIHLGG